MRHVLLGIIAGIIAIFVAVPALAQYSPDVDDAAALGIDVTAIDRDVRPQDDFYRFVNGKWLERTEIPADRSSFGAFTELRDEAQIHVRSIIEEVADGGFANDPDAARIRAAYLAFMDTLRVETLGIAPLEADLARIDGVASPSDLVPYFAGSQGNFGSAPFGMGVGQDQRAADQYAVSISQGGLGLPDRSYYFEDGFAEIRDAYVSYLTRLFELAGVNDAAGSAQAVLALETRLAEPQWTRVQNRDREATYNKMALTDLAAAHPNLAWNDFFAGAGVQTDSVIVRQPSYFDALNDLVVELGPDAWRSWMRARLLDGTAAMLSTDFRGAQFDFRGRTLAGQQEPEPRWRQAVSFTERSLGEAVGRLYVARHFSPAARERMADMIENLRAAFRESIQELDWMSADTKAEALDKLERFNVKIGYPVTWRDYAALQLADDDLVGNARQSMAFGYREMIERLGQPVDRDRWFMTPQTVNAYYSSTMNEIVFPAAILQPPFFNVEADDAVNYGGIGAVIGHEFSHGFDDQGRRSDGHGNLRDWWTEEDAAEYTRRAERLIAQYDTYEPLPGHNIIGAQTIGENIADLAGLTMAYRAYQRSLGGQEAPVIEGFTGDQRFFMGWAQVWRINWREPMLQQQLRTGAHSPGEFRTNGIVPHMDAFHDAFGTEAGDPMFLAPDERLRIW
jgi:putative endopeptidase